MTTNNISKILFFIATMMLIGYALKFLFAYSVYLFVVLILYVLSILLGYNQSV